MRAPYERDITRMLWHPVRGMGDAGASPRHRNGRGLTLLELLVTMAVFGIALGIAVPQTPRGAFVLWGADRQLLADLRETRAGALIKGDHFRFDVTGASTYAEYRMRLQGNVWVVSGPPLRGRTLPSGVIFTAGVGTQLEFNTRGLLVTPGAAASLALSDAHTGHTRQITVWPSGQVAVL